MVTGLTPSGQHEEKGTRHAYVLPDVIRDDLVAIVGRANALVTQ